VEQGTFCSFFVTKDNSVMASSLSVPFDDPTLQMLVTRHFSTFVCLFLKFKVFFEKF
jgi:hypothetical protein